MRKIKQKVRYFAICYIRIAKQNDVLGRAAGMSFYVITSFFPVLCLIFLASAYLSLNVEDLYVYLMDFFPRHVGIVISDVLKNIHFGKTFIAFLAGMAVWTMSGALLTAAKSLNAFYGIKEERNFIVLRIIAILHAFLFLILSFSTMILSVFGNAVYVLLTRLFPSYGIVGLWQTFRYVLLFVIVVFVLACFYKYIPGKKLKFRAVVYGSVVTTILWLASSYVFAFYVNNFSRHHILYGSVTGVIVLISWIYLTSAMLLLGGVVNATGEKMKNLQKK